MELGGNITLQGFEEIDKSKLLVVKKIVGHSVKEMNDIFPDFRDITIILDDASSPTISVMLQKGGETLSASVKGENLFFVLDSVLKKIMQQQ